MRYLRRISNVVGITLVIVLVLTLINDMQPLVIDTHGKDKSVPVSSESSTADQSDECDASCPCVIHMLEDANNQRQIQTTIVNPSSSVWIAQEQNPVSTILESIYRPPKA